jgi:hypothetical protein
MRWSRAGSEIRQKDAEKLAAGIGDHFKATRKVPGLQEVFATAEQIEKPI